MTTTKYEHGTAFQQSYKIELRGEVIGQPCGWGSSEHESNFLQDELTRVITDAVARFYQCKLQNVSMEVKEL